MKLKDFITKFSNKELLHGDECQNFYYSRGVLFYIHSGVKLYLAKCVDDYIIMKYRDDVKGGLKKLFRFIDSKKKVLLVTREIEYLKEVKYMDHKMNLMNIIYYFVSFFNYYF